MENTTGTKTNYSALATLTTVFFFWGFIAAGNSVFIPFCKNYFHLDQFQSQLIDFAFYLAYYVGALLLFVIGSNKGKDIVGSWGYKKSIVYGLLFSSLGAGAMILSVYLNVFVGMLIGLFIVALGFSLQQTSANPFMIALGDEATGSNRINLGGGINSLGTTIGPLIVALALFGTTASISDEMIASLSLSKVILLYVFVGLLFIATASLFGFSKKVPNGFKKEPIEKASKALKTLLIITGLLVICFSPVFSSYRSEEAKKLVQLENDLIQLESKGLGDKILQSEVSQQETKKQIQTQIYKLREPLEKKRLYWLSAGLFVIIGGLIFANIKSKKNTLGWGAMQYPQLVLGMIAIFVYVGVEVAVGSNLGELLKQKDFGGYDSSQIAPFISMYWGSLMIGRWSGSINAFDLSVKTKQILRFLVPLIAFGIILGVTSVVGYNVKTLYWYVLCVLIQIVAFYIAGDKPIRTLFIFGILGVLAFIIGLTSSGMTAIYAFLSVGLFCSIMWPCIFSLSLAGLGKYQAQGSGFLVMMILGGAIIPPIQGKLSDIIGIQSSFFIGMFCMAYIVFFAYRVKKLININ